MESPRFALCDGQQGGGERKEVVRQGLAAFLISGAANDGQPSTLVRT
jgi:hypothetical protein